MRFALLPPKLQLASPRPLSLGVFETRRKRKSDCSDAKNHYVIYLKVATLNTVRRKKFPLREARNTVHSHFCALWEKFAKAFSDIR